MKNLKTLLFAAILFALGGIANAQSVGINADGSAPNGSAMLDVSSTSKGFLPPRISLTATNSASPITSPAAGLLVYNTATAGTTPNNVVAGYYFWNGSAWIALGSTALASQVTGILPVANGGTGSFTQNFVDLTSDQTVAGNKTLSGNTSVGGMLSVNGKIGIGTSSPQSSAALEIRSTTAGLLLPRLTTAERDAMSPVSGLMIFNTNLKRFQGYAGANVPSVETSNSSTGSMGICNKSYAMGQSFTVSNNCNLSGIEVTINDVEVPGDFVLKVFAGSGFSGTMLSQQTVTIANGGLVFFSFPSLIPVISGNSYTIQFSTNLDAKFRMTFGTDDYAGGNIWINTSANLASDLWFQIVKMNDGSSWVDLSN